VRDNLIYIGTMYGLDRRSLNQRIDTLLEKFDLKDKTSARARTLSGGQKRRLNFALAEIHAPNLIVLDEPTVGLDPNARLLVWEIIQGFRQSGKTVVLTTHYMEEAETLCDRIILIDQGRIIAQGTPSELKATLSDEVALEYQVAGLPPPGLISDLKGRDGIRQVNSQANSLRVVVNRACVNATKLWITGTGIAITGMHTEDISLEDVFVHFTGRHLGAETRGITG
jgi:ABC-2 type transport system ATP-binding protein